MSDPMKYRSALVLAILLVSSLTVILVQEEASADIGPFTGKAGDGENGNLRAEYYTYVDGNFRPAIYIYLEGATPIQGSVVLATTPVQVIGPVGFRTQFAVYLDGPLDMSGSPYHLMLYEFGSGEYVADCYITVYERYNTITFDGNGGSGSMDSVEMGSGNYVLPSCGFTPPGGKVFGGWSVGGKTYGVGDTIEVSTDITVRAVWKDIDDSKFMIRVSVSPLGSGTVTGAGAYRSGDTAVLTATAGTGYSFAGWMLDGKIVSVDETYRFTVRSDASFTATFDVLGEPTNVFSITYEPNGGYGAPGKQIKRSASSEVMMEISSTLPKHDSLSFKGWSDSPDGQVKYLPGDTVTLLVSDPEIVLYAVWGEESAPSSIEIGYSSITLPVGSSLKLPVTVVPGDSVYDLVWSSSNESVVSVSSDGTVTALKVGTATVKAMTSDGKVFAECVITVTSDGAIVGTVPTQEGGSVEETLIDDGSGGNTSGNPIVINVGSSGQITYDQEKLALEIAERVIASGESPQFIIRTEGTELGIPWTIASSVSNHDGSLTVVLGKVSLTFSADAVRDMGVPYTGIVICVVPVKVTDVDADVSGLRNCVIYDIYVTVNGVRTSMTFSQPVQITVEYEIKWWWNQEKLYVYYIDPVPMEEVDFEVVPGEGVSFGVSHFSLYAVGYDGCPCCWICWLILALIVLTIIIIIIWKRRKDEEEEIEQMV